MLSLRSEAALGLKFVDAPSMEPPAVAAVDDPPPAAAPRFAAAPAPRPATVAPTALFVPPRTSSARATLGGQSLPVEQRRIALQALDDTEVKGCTKCRLSETRTNTVFGEGDPEASIFFVGEAPGADEDASGRPFVGRAGQLLDKMIAGMGLRREQVFIANVCKCRPPNNRPPAPDEAEACTPYLVRQIETVRPRVIVTLGLTAAKFMLGDNKLAMGKIRGHWYEWRGVKLMPTFHPSYVLRTYTEATRKAVWDDLKQVMGEVGLAVPKGR
jgi:DNA polymerase